MANLNMPRNPQVHFRLKPMDEYGKSLIYLQFLYNKNRLFYSFGQRIEPKHWNPGKQRVKSKNQTTDDGKFSLNDLIDRLEEVCNKAYTTELLVENFKNSFLVTTSLDLEDKYSS